MYSGVPFGEGVRLFLMGAVGLRMNEPSRRSTFMPGTLSTSRVQDGARSTSRRCGGGFAEQGGGNVDKGEAPTLLRERLEIRLDENLDGLFARINLDTNGHVTEIDLV